MVIFICFKGNVKLLIEPIPCCEILLSIGLYAQWLMILAEIEWIICIECEGSVFRNFILTVEFCIAVFYTSWTHQAIIILLAANTRWIKLKISRALLFIVCCDNTLIVISRYDMSWNRFDVDLFQNIWLILDFCSIWCHRLKLSFTQLISLQGERWACANFSSGR